ncbi:uncharacterized protein LOC124945375 [Impatiens glandulifera]|uniref:uncharacterized protein LOC124945375 n=1 Tax=Impatiens glandulifera TaxID=253017 RepID=UPI001FB17886|nr:uncharacterized protein LOC124945375 [Impatiens glandulifera]
MGANGHSFVEWKEQFVSKERGNRIVHYYLKDSTGESVLSVVGTERSVRHMFYVVSDEFLEFYGAETSVHAGFRWRSRREVVNWLTSMLSKKHRQKDQSKSPKDEPKKVIDRQSPAIPYYKGRLGRNLKGHALDIVWSGVAWTCGKQLKHYPTFFRNGITIGVNSFVFVMAEEESQYLAYIEDMYEDKKGQKKVKVRWFHHNQEVKGVVSLRGSHPKEVFITPYAQVISAECVDGHAVVLTREHYEKCLAVIPHSLLARAHLCYRQFKSNRVKPFKLSKLPGYFDQQIFSCFSPDYFEEEELSPEENLKSGGKKTRNSRGVQMLKCGQDGNGETKVNGFSRKVVVVANKNIESCVFKIGDKIELLCQDSGIRGCWFRCTILEVNRKMIKVQYDDLEDDDEEDDSGNVEEWVPAYRVAKPDKLGIRYPGRSTIRPPPPHRKTDLTFDIGSMVDAWWSDGWWEGIVTALDNSNLDSLQICIPSENKFIIVERKDLRISKDWNGDSWVDVKTKPRLVAALSSATEIEDEMSLISLIVKACESSDDIQVGSEEKQRSLGDEDDTSNVSEKGDAENTHSNNSSTDDNDDDDEDEEEDDVDNNNNNNNIDDSDNNDNKDEQPKVSELESMEIDN